MRDVELCQASSYYNRICINWNWTFTGSAAQMKCLQHTKQYQSIPHANPRVPLTCKHISFHSPWVLLTSPSKPTPSFIMDRLPPSYLISSQGCPYNLVRNEPAAHVTCPLFTPTFQPESYAYFFYILLPCHPISALLHLPSVVPHLSLLSAYLPHFPIYVPPAVTTCVVLCTPIACHYLPIISPLQWGTILHIISIFPFILWAGAAAVLFGPVLTPVQKC